MLMYRRTSLLESSAQTLVNTVNCVGVMGKGIAHEFKKRDPEMFIAYKAICDKGLLEPGKLWLWQGYPNWVLNFPTKRHWRHPSRLEWIEAGLEKFARTYADRGITEISFPRLGCGNGGLSWDDVRPLMEFYLGRLSIPIYIHDHTVELGLPEHLEPIAKVLSGEGAAVESFADFLSALRRVTELGVEKPLTDLSGSHRFDADMDDESNLHLTMEHEQVTFEPDDLRAVWMSLFRGVVTEERAGWSSMEGGRAILSLLAVLPAARPIEIQRPDAEPERAVELRPSLRSGAPVPRRDEQLLLAWR
jgi:O-acetyl-ADP-ribose deacetylase (regulator of RNase III)